MAKLSKNQEKIWDIRRSRQDESKNIACWWFQIKIVEIFGLNICFLNYSKSAIFQFEDLGKMIIIFTKMNLKNTSRVGNQPKNSFVYLILIREKVKNFY